MIVEEKEKKEEEDLCIFKMDLSLLTGKALIEHVEFK